MGKRNKGKNKIPTSGDSDSGFGHNPFAAALGDVDAPPGPEPEAATPEATSTEDAAPPKRAVVRRERKGRGGKTVTLISHLDLDADALEQWCATLRKKAGCGGAVEGDLIVLQGDQRARAVALLEEMGVKKVTKS